MTVEMDPKDVLEELLQIRMRLIMVRYFYPFHTLIMPPLSIKQLKSADSKPWLLPIISAHTAMHKEIIQLSKQTINAVLQEDVLLWLVLGEGLDNRADGAVMGDLIRMVKYTPVIDYYGELGMMLPAFIPPDCPERQKTRIFSLVMQFFFTDFESLDNISTRLSLECQSVMMQMLPRFLRHYRRFLVLSSAILPTMPKEKGYNAIFLNKEMLHNYFGKKFVQFVNAMRSVEHGSMVQTQHALLAAQTCTLALLFSSVDSVERSLWGFEHIDTFFELFIPEKSHLARQLAAYLKD